jgi:superfamily II DNA or RNA helicase
MKLIKRTEIEKPEVVYNLEVKKNHNYVANGVVISNCHDSKSSILNSLRMNHGNNIANFYGITGTLPKDPCDLMMVHTALGNIVYECHAKDLIENDYLSKPDITIIQLDDVKYLKENGVLGAENLMNEEEEYFIKNNKSRMTHIANLIIENSKNNEKGNTLVLINNVKYGQELSKMIPDSFCLSGKDKVDVRKEVYDKFENNNNIIAVCTRAIASVGLSIDRIHHLVFLDYNKSFISTIQTIGRGLRKSHDKDTVNILDICSNLPSSKKRMSARIKHYNEAEYPNRKTKMTYEKVEDYD